MKKADQVNKVALHLPNVMEMLDGFFDALVGRGQHNIILLVGAGDVEQYVANVPRARGIASLQSLLARWKIDAPDVLPETPRSNAELELLINDLEKVVAGRGAEGATIEAARDNLRLYVERVRVRP